MTQDLRLLTLVDTILTKTNWKSTFRISRITITSLDVKIHHPPICTAMVRTGPLPDIPTTAMTTTIPATLASSSIYCDIDLLRSPSQTTSRTAASARKCACYCCGAYNCRRCQGDCSFHTRQRSISEPSCSQVIEKAQVKRNKFVTMYEGYVPMNRGSSPLLSNSTVDERNRRKLQILPIYSDYCVGDGKNRSKLQNPKTTATSQLTFVEGEKRPSHSEFLAEDNDVQTDYDDYMIPPKPVCIPVYPGFVKDRKENLAGLFSSATLTRNIGHSITGDNSAPKNTLLPNNSRFTRTTSDLITGDNSTTKDTLLPNNSRFTRTTSDLITGDNSAPKDTLLPNNSRFTRTTSDLIRSDNCKTESRHLLNNSLEQIQDRPMLGTNVNNEHGSTASLYQRIQPCSSKDWISVKSSSSVDLDYPVSINGGTPVGERNMSTFKPKPTESGRCTPFIRTREHSKNFDGKTNHINNEEYNLVYNESQGHRNYARKDSIASTKTINYTDNGSCRNNSLTVQDCVSMTDSPPDIPPPIFVNGDEPTDHIHRHTNPSIIVNGDESTDHRHRHTNQPIFVNGDSHKNTRPVMFVDDDEPIEHRHQHTNPVIFVDDDEPTDHRHRHANLPMRLLGSFYKRKKQDSLEFRICDIQRKLDQLVRRVELQNRMVERMSKLDPFRLPKEGQTGMYSAPSVDLHVSSTSYNPGGTSTLDLTTTKKIKKKRFFGLCTK